MIFQLVTHWFFWPEQGVVEEAISSHGRGGVKYAATSWPAELDTPSGEMALPPDAPVLVMGRRGLVLLVQPLAT
ncbi:NfeD family protein [Leptolyngbya sp. CCNP1308]|uniref:NfeD family protein n=1 Tax=Leptolyngbya sp. CCNP1308 TaxID=3110255 RepID=UPI002B1E9C82|nr:NfeD family protein [Leptolyngbya sp. CCNP1308]MEA5451836.1 NfeD family protein [Leptolyngbya sp. CCNP1308]